MSQIVDRRRGHPAGIDASGQHLPDILADFRVDQAVELLIHGEEQAGVLQGESP